MANETPVTPVASKPTTPVAATPTPVPPDKDVVLASARANASVGRRSARIANDLFDDNVVAKPLSGGEGFFNLRPKNPDVVFRAICHTVNTKDGPSYLRYEQARAQGFTNATPADVVGTIAPSYIKDAGTKIVNGDLILMKMDKGAYRGALKWKDQQAIKAVQRTAVVDQGKAELRRALAETNTPGSLGRKLSTFSPSAAEIAKDFGGSDE